MTPAQFEKQIEPRWQKLEKLLAEAEQNHPTAAVDELPATFRQVCHDLSVAQHRMSPQRLTQKLNALALRTYRVLERHSAGGWEAFVRLFFVEFPQAVRAEWRLFWWCTALFYLPAVLIAAITPAHPEWAMALLGPEGMVQIESMYGESSKPSDFVRESYGSGFAAFCFYIWNNVSINFKTFAGGILGGVGSLFVLMFNSLFLGAVFGYVHYSGNPMTLYAWVVAHGAPEITGMIIAAMAGMRVGWSVLRPGRMERREALVLAGRKALPLLIGAAILTSLAAVLEGFWSPLNLPLSIKFASGGMCWVLLTVFLLFSGRRSGNAA
ncbi:stage II sporulation protein M [Prosthecobacter vanneervenii]|uniref:Putative membrane protein SpoIIM required for sporulation n=1 Tax=Prosthecobacter vanneervenii TaxID=48466 RepID=A0A7W7YCU4_9BACT|nr:stage II sporulation protein M [Prosthecobacter vanneervenii]MBB5033525.1 putative membrane protein SpoIIM required for sporulation [Prosthecobacter vanneervenii]